MRLVAFQPDIAANLGALIRLGACFGAPVDVIGPCGFAFSVKALRRTVMDYAQLAEVTDHDSWEAFMARRAPGRLLLLSTRGARSLWAQRFEASDLIMVGRESAGAPDWVHAAADQTLRIPMRPGVRSLNVATAAAIALAEAARQTAGAALI